MSMIPAVLLADFNLGLFVLQVLLFLSSFFLIALVLLQRGKGGGLSGALGGSGGSSAFGAKASDAFVKITIGTAVVWILLCMLTIGRFNPPPTPERAASNNDATMGATEDGESTDQPVTDTEGAAGEGDTEGATGEGAGSGAGASDAATDGDQTSGDSASTDGDSAASDQ